MVLCSLLEASFQPVAEWINCYIYGMWGEVEKERVTAIRIKVQTVPSFVFVQIIGLLNPILRPCGYG